MVARMAQEFMKDSAMAYGYKWITEPNTHPSDGQGLTHLLLMPLPPPLYGEGLVGSKQGGSPLAVTHGLTITYTPCMLCGNWNSRFRAWKPSHDPIPGPVGRCLGPECLLPGFHHAELCHKWPFR